MIKVFLSRGQETDFVGQAYFQNIGSVEPYMTASRIKEAFLSQRAEGNNRKRSIFSSGKGIVRKIYDQFTATASLLL